MRLGRSIVALLAAGLLAPAAAHAATVTVIAPNGTQHQIQWTDLTPDVQGVTYAVRSAAGTEQRPVTGVSLRAVLEKADAFVEQFRAAEVLDARAAGVSFSRKQATQKDWKGGGPPVFYLAADGLHFLRPSAGGDDDNAEDELLDAANITIRLRQNVEIKLHTSVSDMTPKAGDEIQLATLVSGAGAGEDVAISWVVKGKRIGTGDTIKHAFRKPGTYVVLVTATAGDDYGSATVKLTVGKPKAESQPEPTTTTTTETTPAPAAAPAPPATGDPGTPGGTGTEGATGGTTAPPEPDPAPKPEEPKQPEPQPTDELKPGELRGRVIETVPEPVTPIQPAVVKAAPDAGDGGSDGGGILPPAAWTGIGVCLFLLAGWGLERTGWRPRPWHRGVAA